jgi:hypothetical protein
VTPHAHCAPVTPVLGERHLSSLAGIAPPVEFSSWETRADQYLFEIRSSSQPSLR